MGEMDMRTDRNSLTHFPRRTSMTLSSSTKTISGLLLAFTLLLLAMASSAQAAGPAWTLHMSHNPETFERLHNGHGEFEVAYHVTAENSGDTPTSGTYALGD